MNIINTSDVWNEMSYRFYSNRKNERELDYYEKVNSYKEDFGDFICEEYYGSYEDLYSINTFSVEDLFYLNYQQY